MRSVRSESIDGLRLVSDGSQLSFRGRLRRPTRSNPRAWLPHAENRLSVTLGLCGTVAFATNEAGKVTLRLLIAQSCKPALRPVCQNPPVRLSAIVANVMLLSACASRTATSPALGGYDEPGAALRYAQQRRAPLDNSINIAESYARAAATARRDGTLLVAHRPESAVRHQTG
jgi:hypothetical protein